MRFARNIAIPLYWIVTLTLLAVAVAMCAWYAPVEATMGPVQKILYLHLPVALNTFVAAGIVFIASIGFIWSREPIWDDLAQAAARVAVLFSLVVLLTGMIWARSAWGQWWTWSPRLTFSLVLWLLYTAYLLIRPRIESPQRRALVCAVYGVIAFMDVPLVYLSVKLLPDIHPASVELEPRMRDTLLVWSAAITLLCAGLIWARYVLARTETLQRLGITEPPSDGARFFSRRVRA
jgi:heme exporter protein C